VSLQWGCSVGRRAGDRRGWGVTKGCSVVGNARAEDVEVQVTSSLTVVFCRSKKSLKMSIM
jgi:hypothetical protein